MTATPTNSSANPPLAHPLVNAADAEKLLLDLIKVMDALLGTVEHETELVRAGRLREALDLEPTKTELARRYMADAARIKANAEFLSRNLPEALDALRQQHDTFHALLQINLTVLATAHAVSESIVRGVSEEVARQSAPQTYGKSGRPNNPGASSIQPVALSRIL
jgi:hypothetical protein